MNECERVNKYRHTLIKTLPFHCGSRMRIMRRRKKAAIDEASVENLRQRKVRNGQKEMKTGERWGRIKKSFIYKPLGRE